jgi:cytochrome c oxidase subunit II
MFDRVRGVFRRGPVAAAVATFAMVCTACVEQDPDKQQSALKAKGEAADKILDLTTPFFWIAVVIGIGVVGATVFLALKFRVKPGEERNPKQTHGNSTLEISWTIVPALILAVMGVFTVASIFDLSAEPDDPDTVHINVVGKQWWWEYEYTDGDKFVTANEMHIPIDTPVYLTMTGQDVIHSFWVPNLAGKKDVVPGRTSYLTISGDEVGEYAGQCAEYCGLSHANMRLKVFVDSRDDYDAWVAKQRSKASSALDSFVSDETGLVARYGCQTCHSFAPDTANRGPNLTHLGDRTTFAGGTYDLTLENLTNWIYDAPSLKPMEIGPDPKAPRVGMPSFRKAFDMTKDEAREIATSLLCDTSARPENHEDVRC